MRFRTSSTPSFIPARALDVRCNSMGTDYSLTDTSTHNAAYRASATTLSGHMTITAPDGLEVGSARYGTWSSKIKIVVHGQSTKLTKGGHGKDSQQFQSPAYRGARCVWSDAGARNGLDIVCVDEGNRVLARFCFADSLRRLNDVGRLELGQGAAMEGAVMDELVVTGMAIAQVRLAAT